ncbi:T9SS type A sorting domain-containing protein [Dyadobacter sp. CY107]|uniref:T9SS type A sorting domain-containing protein n=1 Tax=Dyadobacter fanqingshengii TaxID=2906443 RepID=UPI001F26F9A6|nr:T9SS type A sorting domain-containing protein [Dyadobacter fanqingshengii]MCF2505361.1 T9SS type A sorting domain-containing protein [Dyadobacter fanqingshengii]
MKTCTFVICFLLTAITLNAAAPLDYAGRLADNKTVNDPFKAKLAPFTVCLEAETANSDAPVSQDPNASNDLTRGARDSEDYFVDYQTDVPTAGKYLLTIRYYAEENSQVSVSVNAGPLMQIELPASHSWNIAWKEYTFEVDLIAGNNRVRIKELPGYNVRQDKTCWTENGGSLPVDCDYIVGSIVTDYYPSCGQAIGVSADCGGNACAGLSYRWTGPGLDASGSSVSFYAPSENGNFTYTRTSSKPGCPDQTSDFKLTITDCGDGPFQICLEAEDTGGTGPITEDPNASGGKTRGERDRDDYGVFYLVPDVQVEGPHAVTFRYYAEANTAFEVRINDEVNPHKIELPASNSWNIVWIEQTFVFTLRKGFNSIFVKGLPGYRPVRHDKICVEQMPGTPPSCDFTITAQTSTSTPQCGAQVSLTANCTGPDCDGIFYNWTGANGFARYTQNIEVTAPSVHTSDGYNVAAGKDGCAYKNVFVAFTTSCPPAQEPFSACVEAEHSASSGPESHDPNASNGQTRGAQDNYDYFVEYQVDGITKAGFFPVTLRYYAEADAQISVAVNDALVIPSLNLAPTHSWNIVAREETFYITLFAGTNTIRIQGLPGAACRQDKICIGPDQNVYTRMAAPGAPEMQGDIPSLQAYPNPAIGEFNAVFQLPVGTSGTMRLTDTQGRVWHERAVKGKGVHEERIILPGAPAGIYLLQVKKPDSVETKKILFVQ